jgi:hypothetical protein
LTIHEHHGLKLEVALGNTHDIHCMVMHSVHVIQSAKVDGCFLGCEIFDDRLDDKELIDDVPVRQWER